LVEELTAQRAEDRVGERVSVLVEHREGHTAEGRAEHQGPDVDGTTTLLEVDDGVRVGDLVDAWVVEAEGVDLVAEVLA
jgi:tRNA A37 methylthiotransferase MiaB